MEERIDILMATYNGEKYVEEQIKSILNQTYKNFRLIISDDCSTDNTVSILKEFEQKDDRVIVYYQEKNLGYVKNFEFLLEKVENNLYMLADQDDVWLPDKVKISYNTLKERNADLTFSDLTVVDENLNELYPSFMKLKKTFDKAKKYDDYRAVYLYNVVTGCTILSKKKFINKILPIPEGFKYIPHDYWISLIVGMNGKLAFIDKPLIKYRQHANNQIGSRKMVDSFTKFEDVRKLFIDVKLSIFEGHNKYNGCFPDNLKLLSKKALKYYKNIEHKKYFNFKGWNIFHRLYKYDNFKYYIINFIILNMPLFGKILYKLKKS